MQKTELNENSVTANRAKGALYQLLHGKKTINEVRKEFGLDPIETFVSDNELIHEIYIAYKTPFKFEVFINGIELKNVKRFAVDISNPESKGHGSISAPTYTVERYLLSKKG